jgi:quinol monooxygenase YgiN
MIIDLVKFTARQDAIDGALEAMKTQTVANRGDEGFVLTHVFQSKANPAELYMLLGWENQEAVDKHLATQHDAEFIKALDPCLAGPPDFSDWTLII